MTLLAETSMIDRVADALTRFPVRDFTDPGGELDKLRCREAARAAILAMREPNEAQYDALCATNLMWRELNSLKVWQTYIDAALGEDQ